MGFVLELVAVNGPFRIYSCIGNTTDYGQNVPLLVVCVDDRHIVHNGFLLIWYNPQNRAEMWLGI